MKLDVTFVLARILGPLLIAIGVAMITHPQRMIEGAADVLLNNGVRIMGAVLGLGVGLTIAVLNTRFSSITAILITLIGWLTLVRGALLLLAPEIARDAMLLAREYPTAIPIAGCVMALAGVWLAYAGYIAGVLRVESAPPKQR